MRLRRVALASVVLLAVAGIVLGLLTGFFTQVGRSVLGPGAEVGSGRAERSLPNPSDPSGSTGPSQSAPSSTPPSAGSTDTEPALPAPVLPAADEDLPVDPAKLRARIAAAGPAPGSSGVEVVDGAGTVVYTARARSAFIPASTNKLLTAAAALELFGPEHRFTTSVVPGKGREIVLVGGGDPYLVATPSARDHPQQATLTELAGTSAAALQAAKRRSVTLRYDDTLFAGPAWNRLWPAGYRDQVSPTSALWASSTTPNPTRKAVDHFAKALRAKGIQVTVGGRLTTSRSAKPLAAVRSLTVSQIVRQLLLVSDNNAAEVMFRQIGLKEGSDGSIAGGRRAVRTVMTRLGVWTAGTVVHDGSGLARQTAVPPNAFAELLRMASSDDHPQLRGLLTGLSVAGVEGSLRTRFPGKAMQPAEGLVYGKTGTLTGVRSLAGYLRPPDGTMLYYSAVVNGAKDGEAAEVWLQRVVNALAGCGCR